MEDGDLELKKRAERRARTQNAIEKQKRIARVGNWNYKNIEQAHRFAKKHAMDCGRPGCMICGNPRRTLKQRTLQEEKFLQSFKCEWIGDE